jgi:transcriptional regulator with PAS, ATPase and Fis domain
MQEQSDNKRSNINITYKGETENLKQWSKKLGVNYNSLYARIFKYKWDIQKTFTVNN